MRALVAELTKRKYASTLRPHGSERRLDATCPATATHPPADAPCRQPQPQPQLQPQPQPQPQPQRHGRHIPAAVRRAVVERDGMRCTYVDERGAPCGETRRLEFHHIVPFAVRPAHDASNLTLRCAAHNALAAEEDFGRELIRRRMGVHEPYGEQATLCTREPMAASQRVRCLTAANPPHPRPQNTPSSPEQAR